MSLCFEHTLSLCLYRSHQPLSREDSKPCGVGLEAEVVLTRGVSCEGEFTKFTVAFGHHNLKSREDTVRATCPHLRLNKLRVGEGKMGLYMKRIQQQLVDYLMNVHSLFGIAKSSPKNVV